MKSAEETKIFLQYWQVLCTRLRAGVLRMNPEACSCSTIITLRVDQAVHADETGGGDHPMFVDTDARAWVPGLPEVR
jgi:hypothetical protein